LARDFKRAFVKARAGLSHSQKTSQVCREKIGGRREEREVDFQLKVNEIYEKR
jgi:hypothetical protein